ncbi:cytochrome d ubiquinol oxidase subunit II [Amphibiibacter pelophylacis]|uniref:Cytochrome d ubiquinol oxidase subunit II n=1 Tax=Amphibiibacter pelophylacis TaxID=1799477 RepID=A0ACC6P179_9BURK
MSTLPALDTFDAWLPLIFMGLLGTSLLIYALLDGFDLGVGMLLPRATTAQRDQMIASIGPFWDGNGTWLVLGMGLVVVAFPKAQGLIMQQLYLPALALLIGLVLRGVSFDFRIKAPAAQQPMWNGLLFAGSMLASLAQGWMLGRYITGFAEGSAYTAFAALTAITIPATYVLLGACWLVMKTEGELQQDAITWAKIAWPAAVVAVALISIATPWVSPVVRERWFSLPATLALLPVPLVAAGLLLGLRASLNSSRTRGKLCWLPFGQLVGVFVLCAFGLGYSLFPDIVIGRMSAWQGAASPDALKVLLFGVSITLPVILIYTAYVYRVFWGKVRDLRYG